MSQLTASDSRRTIQKRNQWYFCPNPDRPKMPEKLTRIKPFSFQNHNSLELPAWIMHQRVNRQLFTRRKLLIGKSNDYFPSVRIVTLVNTQSADKNGTSWHSNSYFFYNSTYLVLLQSSQSTVFQLGTFQWKKNLTIFFFACESNTRK